MDPVVHFEITTDDRERAQTFYTNVFGWQMHHIPDMDYTIVMTTESEENGMPKQPGRINGGMTKKNESASTPVIVIKVAHIDETIEKIKKAGGSVVAEKMNVGNMGLYARIKDTEDNIIGLWEDLPKT